MVSICLFFFFFSGLGICHEERHASKCPIKNKTKIKIFDLCSVSNSKQLNAQSCFCQALNFLHSGQLGKYFYAFYHLRKKHFFFSGNSSRCFPWAICISHEI